MRRFLPIVWFVSLCIGLLLSSPGNSSPLNVSAATAVPTAAATPAGLPTGVNGKENVLSWLSVYFTDPASVDENNQNLNDYVAHYPLQAIQQAKKTIDITSFDFNLPDFINAVVAAKKRGVVVRIVLDEKNGSQDVKGGEGSDPSDPSVAASGDMNVLQTLAGAQIPVVDGGRSNG